MHIPKNYVALVKALLIFASVFFQCCTTQDAIAPYQEELVIANNDVLQKIKSLGFTENQIKETPNYYLADGDLYFSKNASATATTSPSNKSDSHISGKYATLTIRLDKALAGVMDERWHAGIDQAIAEWNAKEEVHFHFAFTNSADANINIVKDNDLPSDLAIAAEFPRNGRTGSSIRINVATTKVVENPKQAFVHALEHCMGFLHSTSVKNKTLAINSSAHTSARGPRFAFEMYAIQGDGLWRIDQATGQYYHLNDGWTGTEVMGHANGMLYMVQFGTLWIVNPSTGNWDALTDGWEGSQYITNIPGKLYILQDSWIWPVDPDTGLWDANLGKFTLPRGLLGFWNQYDRAYRLAVLRRKPGSSTISLIYTIDPSNGTILHNGTIPASEVGGWNGNFFLAATTLDLMVFNGRINRVTYNGELVSRRLGIWPDVETITCAGNTLYYVNEGSLYANDPEAFTVRMLGVSDDWIDTSLIVFIH